LLVVLTLNSPVGFFFAKLARYKFKPIKRLRLLNKFAETGKQKTLPIELGGGLLRYATITTFLGAGLQALFWDFPLRALLWDQSWWNWCVELLGF